MQGSHVAVKHRLVQRKDWEYRLVQEQIMLIKMTKPFFNYSFMNSNEFELNSICSPLELHHSNTNLFLSNFQTYFHLCSQSISQWKKMKILIFTKSNHFYFLQWFSKDKVKSISIYSSKLFLAFLLWCILLGIQFNSVQIYNKLSMENSWEDSGWVYLPYLVPEFGRCKDISWF